jgi:hypothetical protein
MNKTTPFSTLSQRANAVVSRGIVRLLISELLVVVVICQKLLPVGEEA